MTPVRKAGLLVALLACAAFSSSFAGRFVFDDIHEVARNPAIERSQSRVVNLTAPLAASRTTRRIHDFRTTGRSDSQGERLAMRS